MLTRFSSNIDLFLLIEFFKKLPHSLLSNNAVEKARAFFRSLEPKYDDSSSNDDNCLSSNSQYATINNSSSASSNTKTIDNEAIQKNDVSLTPITPTFQITKSHITKVEKVNPKDIFAHKMISNDQNNDNKLSTNYFHHKYKQYLKPSLLIPRKYYDDILSKRSHHSSTSTNNYGKRLKENILL